MEKTWTVNKIVIISGMFYVMVPSLLKVANKALCETAGAVENQGDGSTLVR